MSKQDNTLTKYWLKHYLDKENGLCSLCGNTGVIFIKMVINPSGEVLKSDYTTYCMCPNGRNLRKSLK